MKALGPSVLLVVGSELAMSGVPTPPPPGEMSSGPVAESWCYTQVRWTDGSGNHVQAEVF